MSRPNLVLELSVLKGLNQIRRNIGRVSSSYLDVKSLLQTTLELEYEEQHTVGPSDALVLKCSAPVRVTVTRPNGELALEVNQLLVLDSPTSQVVVQNLNAEPAQVIVIRCTL